MRVIYVQTKWHLRDIRSDTNLAGSPHLAATQARMASGQNHFGLDAGAPQQENANR